MLFNPNNPSIDADTVLAIQAKCYTLLAGGAVVIQWTSDNTSVSFRDPLPIDYVITQCDMYLRLTDPDTYGPLATKARAYFA